MATALTGTNLNERVYGELRARVPTGRRIALDAIERAGGVL